VVRTKLDTGAGLWGDSRTSLGARVCKKGHCRLDRLVWLPGGPRASSAVGDGGCNGWQHPGCPRRPAGEGGHAQQCATAESCAVESLGTVGRQRLYGI